MRVLMLPLLKRFGHEESGIKRVIEAYYALSSKFGIEFVETDVEDTGSYDVFAVHAGSSDKYPPNRPIVAILHGIYWTSDYDADPWEWKINRYVVDSLRLANSVTVPSPWVAESIARDMRIGPIFVIPHGIDWQNWKHDKQHGGYVLWNKNRAYDVCFPGAVTDLAKERPGCLFMTTFSTKDATPNIKTIGTVPHSEMKGLVQEAMVYLSTTKETFGIGVLEALASGVPVLGFAHGGNLLTVKHGVNGYLAVPGNIEDLARGLDYCIEHRDVLSANAIESVKSFTWDKSVSKLRDVFDYTLEKWNEDQLPISIPSEYYLREPSKADG